MVQKTVRARVVTFTAEENAFDYLLNACNLAKQALFRPRRWKWAVIALHGAVYGFAVCASYGTNYESVLDGNGRLVSFADALKMSGLVLSDKERDSIRRLSKVLRNPFEHFAPMSWTVEVHGMPGIAVDVLNVAQRLASSGQTPRRLGTGSMRKLRFLVGRTSRRLLQSRLHQEAIRAEDRGVRDT
jgi:hypothetical protein